MLQAAYLIGFKSRLTPVASWSLQNEEWACKAPWHAAPAAPTGAWPLSRHPCTAEATVLTAPRAPQAGTWALPERPPLGSPRCSPRRAAGFAASLSPRQHRPQGCRPAPCPTRGQHSTSLLPGHTHLKGEDTEVQGLTGLCRSPPRPGPAWSPALCPEFCDRYPRSLLPKATCPARLLDRVGCLPLLNRAATLPARLRPFPEPHRKWGGTEGEPGRLHPRLLSGAGSPSIDIC